MKILLLIIVLFVIATHSKKDEDNTIHSNAQFSANVYQKLTKSISGNIVVCPLAVQIALGLLLIGAQGNTAKQLSAGLGLPKKETELTNLITDINQFIQNDDDYKLYLFNKMYIQNDVDVKGRFLGTAVNGFNSDIEKIDLKAKNQVTSKINKWIKEKTNDKIKNLINSHDIDDDMVAIIVNAIYFKGTWSSQFRRANTKTRRFYTDNNDQINIDMMMNINKFNYYESSDFDSKFLNMKFKGDDISMTIILPNKRQGLADLEDHIYELLAFSPPYSTQKVSVKIPKFKIESYIKFIPILKALGIVDAFTSDANFGKITSDSIFYINKVLQKATIEINEKGTTATAASDNAPSSSLNENQRPSTEFLADHPFVYYITSSAGIIFIGRFSGN